jgi:hypothetical protein
MVHAWMLRPDARAGAPQGGRQRARRGRSPPADGFAHPGAAARLTPPAVWCAHPRCPRGTPGGLCPPAKLYRVSRPLTLPSLPPGSFAGWGRKPRQPTNPTVPSWRRAARPHPHAPMHEPAPRDGAKTIHTPLYRVPHRRRRGGTRPNASTAAARTCARPPSLTE